MICKKNHDMYIVKLEWGSADDGRSTLRILRHKQIVFEVIDDLQIEDKAFGRGFSWIEEELRKTYEYGYTDGKLEEQLSLQKVSKVLLYGSV